MANPVQEYQTARSMPIPALIAVLNGQSDMVSLGVAHAALKEKMEAEVAKKGAGAMQMAQSPKVVQKDMAMAQGLASTTADLNVPMGGIVGSEGQMSQTAAGGGSVVAFQAGGLGALNMSGNELKSFIDAMTKKGIPPAQVNQFAQQAQAVASQNPSALRGFLSTAARRFGLPGAMIGFTDALIASEKGGRPVTGATPGYDYASEEAISGIEPGVVGPSTNKSSIDQFVSNIGAIMPSGPGAETREAQALMEARQRAAAQNFGQADTGGVPTQTLAGLEAAKAEAAKAEAAKAEEAKVPAGGIADLAASQAQVKKPKTLENIFEDFNTLASKFATDAEPAKTNIEFSEQMIDALKAQGYDFNLISDQIGKLAAEKEELKKDRKEAADLRIIEAGLGILGGESPHAFVNIGKGATPALQGFAKDIKELKKESRALERETMKLQQMNNEMKRGVAVYGLEAQDKQRERMAKHKQKENEIRANMFTSFLNRQTQKEIAQLGADTSLQTARIQASKPSAQVDLINQFPGKNFSEKYANMLKSTQGQAILKEMATKYMAMSATQREMFDRENSELAAQLKQAISGALPGLGMLTEKPGTGPIRK